ncbi:MAG: glyoxalase/bleomycin resistance/extradiol dioxygenase family protein [Kordiimonadaceae bacterium]|jgi:catechol 2,3-dioxygenase-like lactoylglutathione lyase family enzyme|nr:glyoxalase/bleomycin resistance/extradiol dioxygenase family protein [Kordiimonadaceae bacterium]MBT6033367.1 glyoxalase/bleomycin resistance/extradiol dioxygenase family protein [Kordiimonadaceae bacterium]
MKINALDHINIITDDLEGTARFFVDIFDLDLRDGPQPLQPEFVKWLYDDSGRAIFHINSSKMPRSIKRETKSGPTTGAIHHVALDCSDHKEFLARLEAHDISYNLNDIPSIKLKQIFFTELNGVLLELNFRGE